MVFTSSTLTPDSYWRSIVQLGRNSATYKFELGKSLLELQDAENSLITLDELAVPFAKNLAEHLFNCPAQANRPGRFIKALQDYNVGTGEDMGAIRWGLENIISSLGYQIIRDNPTDLPLKGFKENQLSIPNLEYLSDEDLSTLNDILPWASFVVDSSGRRFGKPFSAQKRNTPEVIPDPRIIYLHERIPLTDLTVLEIGCFEGNHTCTLSALAKQVIAVDSRIEHVIKTLVRCAMFDQQPDVLCLDLEEDVPAKLDLHCDVLHHVGVLYHLTDPVSHLLKMGKLTRKAVLLDTHIAPESEHLLSYSANGRSYEYYRFGESGRSAPFAGMRDHAKWLKQEDLTNLLNEMGFVSIDVIEVRQERNGPRIQLLAQR